LYLFPTSLFSICLLLTSHPNIKLLYNYFDNECLQIMIIVLKAINRAEVKSMRHVSTIAAHYLTGKLFMSV